MLVELKKKRTDESDDYFCIGIILVTVIWVEIIRFSH